MLALTSHRFVLADTVLNSNHLQDVPRREMSVTHSSGCSPRQQTSTTLRNKSCSHGMTNFSIPEVNMLKNSSTLAVSFSINLSINLSFVFVNHPWKTYFVDAPRILHCDHDILLTIDFREARPCASL